MSRRTSPAGRADDAAFAGRGHTHFGGRLRAAHYDATCGAWVLSTHRDVLMALRNVRLAIPGEGPPTARDQEKTPAGRALRNRDAHADALRRLRDRDFPHAQLEASARARAAALPRNAPVDLVADYARPWALSLAGAMSGSGGAPAPGCSQPAPGVIADETLSELAQLARIVFLDAAHATSPESAPAARVAVAELAARLPGDGTALHVQAFVAITQTLPHVLASVWLSLFRDPDAVRVLRNPPGVTTAAVDELLRHAGPSQAVFRHARDDVHIGDAHIRAGDAVVLRLAAANHDPDRFSAPGRLDFTRTGAHLAFGHGAHTCPGASVVRAAVRVMTGVLLESSEDLQLQGALEWINGFAVRAPATLPVRLVGGPLP